MKKTLWATLIIGVAACSNAPTNNIIRASAFIEDVNAPPVKANAFVYDSNAPVLRASQFEVSHD